MRTRSGKKIFHACQDLHGQSLFLRCCSFASTLKSSSVVVSPVTFAPLAISFSSRRMIFPLRVFGKRFGKTDFIRLGNRADVLADVLAQFRLQLATAFNARSSASRTRQRPAL